VYELRRRHRGVESDQSRAAHRRFPPFIRLVLLSSGIASPGFARTRNLYPNDTPLFIRAFSAYSVECTRAAKAAQVISVTVIEAITTNTKYIQPPPAFRRRLKAGHAHSKYWHFAASPNTTVLRALWEAKSAVFSAAPRSSRSSVVISEQKKHR
jgi:hypothetical protein